MSKDPAFLFYPADWMGGTMGMTFEEKGAYLELLMLQFNRGHMTSHMIGQTIGQLWDKVQDKFVQDEKGLWYNDRLDVEKEKRKIFTESRKNNIKGKNQYTKKSDHTDGHMTSHMVNVNINENEINKGDQLFFTEDELLKELQNSETWKEQIARKFKIEIKTINEKILDFHSEQIITQNTNVPLKEYQSHFYHWLKKHLNGQTSKSITKDRERFAVGEQDYNTKL